MKKVWEVAEKFLYPNGWVIALAAIAGFVPLPYVLYHKSNGAIAYIVYCLSAYALVVLSLAAPRIWRGLKNSVRNSWAARKLRGTKFGGRYFGDLTFRGSVSIYQGMTVNFLYVVFRIVAGVRYASIWFISMAAYYLVLGILRAYLIRCHRRGYAEKVECYRRTAWLMFLLNVTMGGMILQMILKNSGYTYPGYIIYLSAMYTFYTMIISIVNLVKFRRLGDPVLSAAKVLNFVSALMSILGLQTAMISHFSKNGEDYRRLMNTITGGIIYGIVIGIAVYMLIHSKKIRAEGERV